MNKFKTTDKYGTSLMQPFAPSKTVRQVWRCAGCFKFTKALPRVSTVLIAVWHEPIAWGEENAGPRINPSLTTQYPCLNTTLTKRSKPLRHASSPYQRQVPCLQSPPSSAPEWRRKKQNDLAIWENERNTKSADPLWVRAFVGVSFLFPLVILIKQINTSNNK